ncbi:sensor histidine kinase [Paenibacillus yanchengensis]|uniref:Sensor histidine kinase n=1 Tax=Paenibacillus yanchengensis TaxID=2035833 RepID=A0ABW4YHN2_9BACL
MLGKLPLIRNFGLKQIALLLFMLLIILPTLGVGIIVQYKFAEILQKNVVQSTLQSVDSVANQLEEQISMVEDIADYLVYNPHLNAYLQIDAKEYSERVDSLEQSVEGLLIFHLFSKPYIRSITIDGMNGRYFAMGEPVAGDESKWRTEALKQRGKIVWSEGYQVASGWSGSIDVVSLFRILNLYKDVTTPLGTLTIHLDAQSIISLLETTLLQQQGYVYVLNQRGESVLQSNNALESNLQASTMLERFVASGERLGSYEQDGTKYYTFYRQVENTNWHIVTAIPHTVVDQQLSGLRWMMIAIIAAILLLCIIAYAGFQYMIISPILRLKNETTRVTLGDFTARVPVQHRNEISDLNRKFNEMVDTIRALIDQKYKMEIRQRDAELKLLQSQMDPHFLYNTLDTIRWTARLEKADRSSHLIEMLSKFLRSSLNNGQYETTLIKELEFVQSYLYLHQVRLGDRLNYSLYIEYPLENIVIPKTMIQPLVENFLIHGYNRKKSNNTIAVKVYAVGEDYIWIDVRDNGKGIPPEQLQQLQVTLQNGNQSDQSFGAINNIAERLTIFFGVEAKIEIASIEDEATQVLIKIPYIVGGEQNE